LCVSDFHVHRDEHFIEVTVVIDVVAGRIVGCGVSSSLVTDFILDALGQAIRDRCRQA
jgi:transposase InsO family protein